MSKKVILSTGLTRKGAQYANRKQRQFVSCLLWIVAVCLMLWAWAEPASASSSEIAYQIVLISVEQLADKFNFPQPTPTDRTVTIGKSILKAGESAHYFEAHTIPTLLSNTEKGDITTTGTNTFTVIMGGDRTALKNFVEEYSGGKFIILFKHIKDTVWHIIGEAERPMVLSTTESKNDADGRYTTLTFTRNSVYLDSLVAWTEGESINDLLTGNPAANAGG